MNGFHEIGVPGEGLQRGCRIGLEERRYIVLLHV
jgi:hypothetical protein